MNNKIRTLWLLGIGGLLLALGIRCWLIWPTWQHTTHHAGVSQDHTAQLAQAVSPTPTPRPLRPDLATGMIFPQWGAQAYGPADANWTTGLNEIQQQTAARWVSIPITFHQANEWSTQVLVKDDTPTPEALRQGIQLAHQKGFYVYVVPLLTLDGLHAWAGYVQYTTDEENRAWFDSYWQALQPYVQASEQAGAERFALGNEFEGLQSSPAAFWQQLIQHVHSIFSRQIVYSMNWSSLKDPIPTWMHDPGLAEIGVSTYFPLTATPTYVAAQALPALWQTQVQVHLDAFAAAMGKPIFISEIGYRDSSDAAYNPWEHTDPGTQDDAEQAALYNAALQDVASDRQIDGIFFWAWSLPPYAPNNKPAARILHKWFSIL